MNLVSEDYVRKQGLLSKLTPASFKLIGVTGTPLQVLGVIPKAEFKLASSLFQADLVVTSKLSEDCILGQCFLEKYNMVMDFGQKTLSSPAFIASLSDKPTPKRYILSCSNDTLVSQIKTINCVVLEIGGSIAYYTLHRTL